MNEEVPRRDAVVILSVTALIVALIVLFLAHTHAAAGASSEPGANAPPAWDTDAPHPTLSISGE